jgi:hypothetical protein
VAHFPAIMRMLAPIPISSNNSSRQNGPSDRRWLCQEERIILKDIHKLKESPRFNLL